MSAVEDLLLWADSGFCLGAIFTLRKMNREIARLKKLGIKPKEEPQVCSCTHYASFHDEKGCHDVVKRYIGRDKKTGDKIMRHDPCACVRYVGPGSVYDPGLEQDIARAARNVGDHT
jgi:hypothetical protein